MSDSQNVVLPKPIPYGKYYLLERVNAGGMAEVFKAKAFGVEGFERFVAVKKILDEIAQDKEFIRMFIDEAKLAGQLQHANIAQIFDLGRVGDSYYIALEYVAGKDLRTVWHRARKRGAILPIDMVCHLIMKLCEGLEYAHNKADATGRALNIVHRDVSPQNILISYEGEVKVIDFGVAKAATSSTETRAGILKGKLSYMSPEQVRGLVLDRRSDTFAVGIVLYELLTGERLFLGESDFETLEKIRKVEVAPPTLFNPNIPKELEDIVLKALQKNPNHRYSSAHEMQIDIQKFMFNVGLYYSAKDLAAIMQQLFDVEVADERKKFEYFQSLRLQNPNAAPPVEQSRLSWDDDESETQVFDKEDEEDSVDALENFVPPSSDVVWAKPKNASGRQSIVGGPTRESSAPKPISEEDIPWDRLGDPPIATPTAAAIVESARPARSSGTAPIVQPQRKSSAGLIIGVVVLLLCGIAALIALMLSTDKFGNLTIDASPDDVAVTVLLDGVVIHEGELPVDLSDVPVGTHEIVIRAVGYQELVASIDLAANETRELNRTLNPVGSVVVPIASSPSNLRVFANGSEVGRTPYVLSGLPGSTVQIQLQNDAGQTVLDQGITLNEGVAPIDFTQPPPEATDTSTPVALNLASGMTFTIRGADNVVVAEGTTPHDPVNLERGTAYQIELSQDGFDTATHTFTPGAEGETPFAATLVAEVVEQEVTPPVNTDREERSERDQAERDARAERDREARAERDREAREQREREQEEEEEEEEEEVLEVDNTPGTLNVQSRPAARVHIDGEDTGRYTPLIGVELEPGRHRVRLVNDEFGFDRSYTVTIQPGRTRNLIGSAE